MIRWTKVNLTHSVPLHRWKLVMRQTSGENSVTRSFRDFNVIHLNNNFVITALMLVIYQTWVQSWCFLHVENMAATLILFVQKISINNTKDGLLSLIVYARNGAIPTNTLFDYTIDLTRNQLTIQLPKIGVWYFYIIESVL